MSRGHHEAAPRPAMLLRLQQSPATAATEHHSLLPKDVAQPISFPWLKPQSGSCPTHQESAEGPWGWDTPKGRSSSRRQQPRLA